MRVFYCFIVYSALLLTPKSLSGIVATHTAIAAPATSAPANALISIDATGYVEPITAPSKPATIANAESAGLPSSVT